MMKNNVSVYAKISIFDFWSHFLRDLIVQNNFQQREKLNLPKTDRNIVYYNIHNFQILISQFLQLFPAYMSLSLENATSVC